MIGKLTRNRNCDPLGKICWYRGLQHLRHVIRVPLPAVFGPGLYRSGCPSQILQCHFSSLASWDVFRPHKVTSWPWPGQPMGRCHVKCFCSPPPVEIYGCSNLNIKIKKIYIQIFKKRRKKNPLLIKCFSGIRPKAGVPLFSLQINKMLK